MTERIRNDETVAPGTFVRGARGTVVHEVIETEVRHDAGWLMGRLRDTRTGRSVGWKYLDTMIRVTADGAPVHADGSNHA